MFVSIPAEERKKSVLLDVGCGPGHILCVGQICKFKKYAGIEEANYSVSFESNWKTVTELQICDLSRPKILWDSRAENTVEWVPPSWNESLVVL
eukprot:g28267.t1